MSLKINNKENKIYIVVGAPKSATSLIANGLIQQGIYMGRNADKDKTRGCFDAREISTEILNAVGGRMVDPPDEEAVLKLDFSEKIKAFIKKRTQKMWGFKDPKASLTGRLFLPHLKGDVYLFCCFRKPAKVKKSYRGSFPITRINKCNLSIINLIKDFCEL